LLLRVATHLRILPDPWLLSAAFQASHAGHHQRVDVFLRQLGVILHGRLLHGLRLPGHLDRVDQPLPDLVGAEVLQLVSEPSGGPVFFPLPSIE
jgi:hypothetical protein